MKAGRGVKAGRGRLQWWVKFALVTLVTLYILATAALFFVQRKLIYPAPQEILQVPAAYEEVTLRTSDGLTLRSAYRSAEPGKPTMVFFNGNAGSMEWAAQQAQPFLDAGYGMLLPSYPGYSGNPGEPNEDSFYNAGRAAFKWLRDNGVAPGQTISMGWSIGSGTATEMAREFQPGHLILLAPFSSLADSAAPKFPYFPVRMLLRDKFDNRAKIGAFNGPVLVVHGSADQVVDYSNSQALKKQRPDIRLVTVSGAGHSLFALPAVQNTIMNWLDDHDDPTKQYDDMGLDAGLNAPHIVETVLSALRHNSAGIEEARA